MAVAATVLVVDDEYSVRESIRVWLKKSGFAADGCGSGEEALARLAHAPYDVVFLDIKMPGMDGLEALRQIKENYPATQVVMMTAYGSVESAVDAMKKGAVDYLMKPLDPEMLDALVTRLARYRELLQENLLLREQVARMGRFQNLIGRSEPMRELFASIHDVASTDSSVFIHGETGTGKEMVARAIHSLGRRRQSPFIAVNCGAMSEHLLESELFGHEKGAFTGASQLRRGRLELCEGGTLFLDEIGAIAMRMQVDLLRVLEEKAFYRVGGEKPIKVDFRLLAATNQDLQEGIREGTFRSDLFYRINVISLRVPPLRERQEDIPLLAQFFLEGLSRDMNREIDSFSREAIDLLVHYSWPGNVRELQNAIERAVVLAKGRQIGVGDLAFLQPRTGAQQLVRGREVDDVVREHIEQVIRETGGNISKAADVLGMHRATLHRKIKQYGLIIP